MRGGAGRGRGAGPPPAPTHSTRPLGAGDSVCPWMLLCPQTAALVSEQGSSAGWSAFQALDSERRSPSSPGSPEVKPQARQGPHSLILSTPLLGPSLAPHPAAGLGALLCASPFHLEQRFEKLEFSPENQLKRKVSPVPGLRPRPSPTTEPPLPAVLAASELRPGPHTDIWPGH